MKKGNSIAWEIKSHIMAAGYTQKEAVDACAMEFGWSDSDSNFSNKLKEQTLRYKEALELAYVLAMRSSGASAGSTDIRRKNAYD